MLTRDSLVLWLGIVSGLVLYCASNKPPWEWDWYGWLAFVGYVISVVSAKLGTSPLAGDKDPKRDTSVVAGVFRVKD